MRNAARQTRDNRTITVDFRSEVIYPTFRRESLIWMHF